MGWLGAFRKQLGTQKDTHAHIHTHKMLCKPFDACRTLHHSGGMTYCCLRT